MVIIIIISFSFREKKTDEKNGDYFGIVSTVSSLVGAARASMSLHVKMNDLACQKNQPDTEGRKSYHVLNLVHRSMATSVLKTEMTKCRIVLPIW